MEIHTHIEGQLYYFPISSPDLPSWRGIHCRIHRKEISIARINTQVYSRLFTLIAGLAVCAVIGIIGVALSPGATTNGTIDSTRTDFIRIIGIVAVGGSFATLIIVRRLLKRFLT
jgi:hypothetical protein